MILEQGKGHDQSEQWCREVGVRITLDIKSGSGFLGPNPSLKCTQRVRGVVSPTSTLSSQLPPLAVL